MHSEHTQLPMWQTFGRRISVPMIAAATAVVVAAQPALATASPAPVATRDGKPTSVEEVLEACDRSECRFLITGGPTEYFSAVTNVGSVFINCTSDPMTVTREVILASSTTDNINAEISGSYTHEGTVEATTEAQVEAEKKQTSKLTNENSQTDHTAPKDKGPNTETTGKTTTETTTENTGKVTGKNTVKVGVKEAFTAAFKLAYGKSWTKSVQERVQTDLLVRPNDVLVLGAQNAMVRTQGDLIVNENGTESTVQNITVTSPSTVNASSVVAQTFTDQEKCQTLRPKRSDVDPPVLPPSNRAVPVQPDAKPVPGHPGLYEVEMPIPDGEPNSVKVIKPSERTIVPAHTAT